MAPDPRSPSLDAAVEAMATAHRAECRADGGSWRGGNDREYRAMLEAALPHLQSSPEGVASEPRPSRAKGSEVLADAPSGEAQEPSRCPHCGGSVHHIGGMAGTKCIDCGKVVDRPREPSPELRDRMAEIAARAIEGRDGQHPYGREFRRHYGAEGLGKFAADAVLDALREEQGR